MRCPVSDPAVELTKQSARITFRWLARKNPEALREFLELCRDRTHRLSSEHFEVLHGFRIVEDNGTVHEIVREIALDGSVEEALNEEETNADT